MNLSNTLTTVSFLICVASCAEISLIKNTDESFAHNVINMENVENEPPPITTLPENILNDNNLEYLAPNNTLTNNNNNGVPQNNFPANFAQAG